MIKEIVGEKIYNVWLEMLNRLTPDGRTHRIAVIVAGMIKYTSEIAYEKQDKSKVAEKFSSLIESSYECYDDQLDDLIKAVEKIFIDAGVNYTRVNSRGDSYSIVEESINQFLAWDNMPWES